MASAFVSAGAPAPLVATAPPFAAAPQSLLEPAAAPARPAAPPAAAQGPTAALACGAAVGLALAAAGGRQRQRRGGGVRGRSVACRVSIGDRVLWSGRHQGTVRFLGGTNFASGEWAGVELDEPRGRHDGSLLGFSYFECAPEHGVFCQPALLAPAPAPVPAPVAAPPTAATAAATAAAPPLALGQRVIWSGKHEGTVRFVGETHFAPGEWVGVELDAAAGKHDGSFMGVSYFDCAPQHGVFARAEMLQTGGTTDMRVLEAALEAAVAKAAGAEVAEQPAAAAAAAAAPPPDAPAPAPVPAKAAAEAPAPAPQAPEAPRGSGSGIRAGDLVEWSGLPGVVRYVGSMKLVPGEWVGVELESAGGRNDGCFMGSRYFQCAPGHGVFCQAVHLKMRAPA